MKKQTFIFFISVIILIALCAYILISSTEKKVAVTSSETANNRINEVIAVENEIYYKNGVRIGFRFNKHGELIQFDPSYAKHYYSLQRNDEVMDSLVKRFNVYYNSWLNYRLQALFFDDSILYYDFFYKDFFTRRYALNKTYFEDMMTELDSIKNNFYSNHKY